jgi:predicted transcriptional regulator
MPSILVRDFMDPNPHAIHYATPIRTAVEAMVAAKIIGAPIIDEAKHVVGFVSEQDCIKELLNDAFFCEDSMPVSKVMNRQVQTVSPDTSIFEVAEKMVSAPPKNYPVVQHGRLVGVISRSRVLEALLVTSEDCYLHHT